MKVDKPTLAKLRKFAKVFADAREHDANESDTVMYLIKFFEEVFEYDPLAGEIKKEVPVNERYCDFAIRVAEKTAFLVEAKSAGTRQLSSRNIEQAENYASRTGVNWVLLTNGVVWQFYHLKFGEKIENEIMFEVNLVDELEEKPDWVWNNLSVLSKRSVREDSLDSFYDQQKLLNPKSMVNLLLSEEVLMKLRQELNRKAPNRLELTTVFEAVRDIISQEALAIAGDIMPPARKKHRHKHLAEESSEGGDDQPEAQGATPSEAAVSTTNLESSSP